MRVSIEKGIDVERGLLNGAEAALRYAEPFEARTPCSLATHRVRKVPFG